MLDNTNIDLDNEETSVVLDGRMAGTPWQKTKLDDEKASNIGLGTPSSIGAVGQVNRRLFCINENTKCSQIMAFFCIVAMILFLFDLGMESLGEMPSNKDYLVVNDVKKMLEELGVPLKFTEDDILDEYIQRIVDRHNWLTEVSINDQAI